MSFRMEELYKKIRALVPGKCGLSRSSFAAYGPSCVAPLITQTKKNTALSQKSSEREIERDTPITEVESLALYLDGPRIETARRLSIPGKCTHFKYSSTFDQSTH